MIAGEQQRGFTLVEIIVGIVVGSIALSLLATLIFPLLIRSVEPIIQIRTAEYAQSIMEDVMAKRYDELTPLGGQPVCSPCSTTLGPEAGEADRGDYNDVDDFNQFCTGTHLLQNVFGDVLDASDEYGSNYTFTVCVSYAGVIGGVDTAKRIDIVVTPPGVATPVAISAYRGNY